VNATTAGWSAATVEAWILTELAPGEEGKIVDWIGPNTTSEISLFVDDATAAFKSGVGNVNLLTSSIVLGGKWHHGVVVVTASSASVYVDGKLESTMGLSFPARPAAGGVFAIGVDYDAPDSGFTVDPQECFKGRIAEVAIYDHVLTPERVAAHYNTR
jgi:hypothetical protein